MVTTEQARYDLYQRLESTLGEEATGTLMSYLPPVGWADVATKRDLDNLRSEVKSDIATLRYELLAEFHRELTRQTRTIIFSVLGALVGMSGLAVALAGLF